ncbi:hypothetical protein F5Y19DRAFT_338563 [Xylariaceae sp. FL1651]|nr:hypothetical protein F5Y19DRAFT_338563 [Xylariaceae sp. FL1651]
MFTAGLYMAASAAAMPAKRVSIFLFCLGRSDRYFAWYGQHKACSSAGSSTASFNAVWRMEDSQVLDPERLPRPAIFGQYNERDGERRLTWLVRRIGPGPVFRRILSRACDEDEWQFCWCKPGMRHTSSSRPLTRNIHPAIGERAVFFSVGIKDRVYKAMASLPVKCNVLEFRR